MKNNYAFLIWLFQNPTETACGELNHCAALQDQEPANYRGKSLPQALLSTPAVPTCKPWDLHTPPKEAIKTLSAV